MVVAAITILVLLIGDGIAFNPSRRTLVPRQQLPVWFPSKVLSPPRIPLFMNSVSADGSSSSSMVQLTSDGGVQKDLLVVGTEQAIQTGDILAVEYQAYLEGSNRPFSIGEKQQFIFQDGSMIKGWDIGVGSMKIGERAIIKCSADYAYGTLGIPAVIPPGASIEMDINIVAWLGNQLKPETLFQRDLDIDPFVASTPEAIQAEFAKKQEKKLQKDEDVDIIGMYIKRFSSISFGFGGSNFFASQSGKEAPLILNPNFTFPAMIAICLGAFLTVIATGSVKEKGEVNIDLEFSRVYEQERRTQQNGAFFG